MGEFVAEWLRALSFGGGFNTNVVLCAAILLGVAAGTVGVFSMLRKESLVADAFAHASLAGVAAAFLVRGALAAEGNAPRSMELLLLGAGVSGSLAVGAIGWLTRRTRLTADTATAAVSSASFGLGICLLSVARRAGGAGQAGLDSLIFGSAASMTRADAWTMGVLAALTLTVTLVASKPLTAIAFSGRYARTTGLRVPAIEALLAALVAAVTLAGMQAVGMLLIVALLVIPPATARLWVRRVPPLLALSASLGGLSAWAGTSLSAAAPNAPTGALIVLTASALFVVSLAAAPERGIVAGLSRRARLRRDARAAAIRAREARGA